MARKGDLVMNELKLSDLEAVSGGVHLDQLDLLGEFGEGGQTPTRFDSGGGLSFGLGPCVGIEPFPVWSCCHIPGSGMGPGTGGGNRDGSGGGDRRGTGGGLGGHVPGDGVVGVPSPIGFFRY
jgi:hypothetical protein